MASKVNASLESSSKVYLSSSVTVACYRELEAAQNRMEIAGFIAERFRERYLLPVLVSNAYHSREGKSGFTMLAIACLMVETLEAFYQGLESTYQRSRQMFIGFFNRWDDFKDFRPVADSFFDDVRCGILHQAETRNGWVIRRAGKLYDPVHKSINATAFLKALDSALAQYCQELESADWNSILWLNLRKKMSSIILNCRR